MQVTIHNNKKEIGQSGIQESGVEETARKNTVVVRDSHSLPEMDRGDPQLGQTADLSQTASTRSTQSEQTFTEMVALNEATMYHTAMKAIAVIAILAGLAQFLSVTVAGSVVRPRAMVVVGVIIGIAVVVTVVDELLENRA